MDNLEAIPIYDLAISARVGWQAHSLSNAGNNGSNRTMPRRQLLADGTVTDACSGEIVKHHHAVLTAEYLTALGTPLCPACAVRDGRRAAALIEHPDYKELTMTRILQECGLCDIHGFLVTAKNAGTKDNAEDRQRLAKNSVVDFAYTLALPGQFAESDQLNTRSGDAKEGQMLMKKSVRSGEYAISMRYSGVAIGVDSYHWQVVVRDPAERLRRHQSVLLALRDWILSPDGAMTATLLPHLTGLQGAIVVKPSVGRAPLCSALMGQFVEQLAAMAGPNCIILPFDSPAVFYAAMERLIMHSYPCLPAPQPVQERKPSSLTPAGIPA